MKSKSYIITSLDVMKQVSSRLIETIIDGKTTITFSDTGSKNAKQRGLQWLWNIDVSKAGIGGEHEDTPAGVHLVAKFKFALPIMIRKDPLFADLWQGWYEKHQYDKEALMYFVDIHVSTESKIFTVPIMAEYLTNFKNYYGIKHGVNLTEPSMRGLLGKES